MIWAQLIFFLSLFFLSSCSIFNAGSAKIKYTETKATFFNKSYVNKKDWTNTSFSIRNIQHPETYGEWNLKFRLTPSIHGDQSTLKVKDRTVLAGDLWMYPDVYLIQGSVLGNLGATLHTPLGSFAGAGGYGIALYKARSAKGKVLKTTGIRKLDFAYTAFFARRWFVRTGPRWYYSGKWDFLWSFHIGLFWGDPKDS